MKLAFIKVTRWAEDETEQHSVSVNVQHIITIEHGGELSRFRRIRTSDGDVIEVVESYATIIEKIETHLSR